MNDFILRPMTAADIDVVYEIERDVYRIDPWSKEQIASEFIGVPETRFYVIAEGERRVIGYGGLFAPSHGVAADVQTVTVVNEMQGKGIGRALLTRLIEEASRRSAPAILLEVRVGNDSAIHLYQSSGFVEIARRPNYYGRDLHALVMRKSMLDDEAAK